MLALRPEAVWQAVAGHLPEREEKAHPLGCHRRRVTDRECFGAILFRLITGCSWDVAGSLGKGGETTLRRGATSGSQQGSSTPSSRRHSAERLSGHQEAFQGDGWCAATPFAPLIWGVNLHEACLIRSCVQQF